MPILTNDPVANAMCFVLGYIEKEPGKGLYGSSTQITAAIASAKKNFHLRDDQVASLKTIFNVNK